MIQDILSIKSNYVITGRAASALYLVANFEKLRGKQVLFPCNVCYAAIFPFVYSGCIPKFCDVDLKSGNLTLDIIKSEKDYSAILVPHMYGNPVEEIGLIKEYCNNNGILLIEDCASAMGAEVLGIPCGSFGDYSIFSTGYSKTVDLGGGGILISDRDLSEIMRCESNLPERGKQAETDEAFLGKLYRLIRNNADQGLSQFVWEGLHNNLRHIYIYRCPEHLKKEVKNSLNILENVVKKRREENKLYTDRLENVSDLEIYRYFDKSVPWRFCCFTDTEKKAKIIKRLLSLSLPVSDWYPVVTGIFGQTNYLLYPNALQFEKTILNFPILVGQEMIEKICNEIKEALKGE